jgi:small-conductance mechanosensitive channel
VIVEARNLLDEAVRPWTLFQLALLLVLFAAARLFSGQLYPLFEQRLRHLRQDRRTLRFLVLLLHRLQPILFLLLIWLTVGVMRELTWPSRSFLLGVVASLVAAWLVISIAARLIRNPPLRRVVAGLALAFAALNILGLFQETMAWLDGVAFTLGEARISLLTIGKGLLWLVLLIWAAHSLSRALDRRIARLQDLTPSVQVLLGKLLRIVLLAIAIIVPLQAIGVDLTALTIFSGAIGLGLGFGLQKVVSNLISGIILLLDKSIKPGDVISLGQTFGWITSLGARYASVITRDGREYLIPNEDLITQQVVNWS